MRVARCRVGEDIFCLSPKALNCPHTWGQLQKETIEGFQIRKNVVWCVGSAPHLDNREEQFASAKGLPHRRANRTFRPLGPRSAHRGSVHLGHTWDTGLSHLSPFPGLHPIPTDWTPHLNGTETRTHLGNEPRDTAQSQGEAIYGWPMVLCDCHPVSPENWPWQGHLENTTFE